MPLQDMAVQLAVSFWIIPFNVPPKYIAAVVKLLMAQFLTTVPFWAE